MLVLLTKFCRFWLLSGPRISLLWYSVLFTVDSLSLFISFLYLDLYVLGDDALISYGFS